MTSAKLDSLIGPVANDERKLFGTDGIRGVANEPPMTPEIALRLGRADRLRRAAAARTAHVRVVIGKDTRLSGYMFETALAVGHLRDGRARHALRPASRRPPSRTSRRACAPTRAS